MKTAHETSTSTNSTVAPHSSRGGRLTSVKVSVFSPVIIVFNTEVLIVNEPSIVFNTKVQHSYRYQGGPTADPHQPTGRCTEHSPPAATAWIAPRPATLHSGSATPRQRSRDSSHRSAAQRSILAGYCSRRRCCAV